MSTRANPVRGKGNRVSIEVTVLWGDTVLRVDHLSPPREFSIGDGESVDVVIPPQGASAQRTLILRAPRGSAPTLLIPEAASGLVHTPGEPRPRSVMPLVGSAAERTFPLVLGSVGWITIGALTLRIEVIEPEARVPITPGIAQSKYLILAMVASVAAHGWWLAWAILMIPPLGLTDSEDAARDQLVLLQHYLQASAERERDWPEAAYVAPVPQQEGGSGTRAIGEEGAMGSTVVRSNRDRRWGVKGPRDNPDPHIAMKTARQQAAEFGLIGLLNAGAGGDPFAPAAPWGRDESLGADPVSALGTMWGDPIGDSFGGGGLGLSGVGEGGGGRGEGLGLGRIKTIGQGAGTGSSRGFGAGSHRVGPVFCLCGASTVSGRLPPEAIQRVVRASFGRFRFCYEKGLRANPSLAGRVSVRFVIARDGSVAAVGDAGSDLRDREVVQCVERAFYGLSFPQPEGGIVTVIYPIVLSPTS
ncbi:MAG: AgmX/PglI C-terminal domain-containing protein [Deltaproteobacteria bacterium]|nr:AgmX/PglI C-terminal domain-containing protein [Deltaproteobacteria bacterium]